MSNLFAPDAISHYVPNRRGCNAVITGKLVPVGFTTSEPGSYLASNSKVYLVTTKARTALSDLISHVVGISAWKYMGRITTGRIVAMVEAVHTWGQGAINRFPCETVGIHPLTVDIECAVPLNQTTQPRPASIGAASHINLGPKATSGGSFTTYVVARLRTISGWPALLKSELLTTDGANTLRACYTSHGIISLLDSVRAGVVHATPGLSMPSLYHEWRVHE